jgi:hypothetical protein
MVDPAAALLPQVDAAAHALGVMRQLLETHDQRFGAHARRVSELEQENQQLRQELATRAAHERSLTVDLALQAAAGAAQQATLARSNEVNDELRGKLKRARWKGARQSDALKKMKRALADVNAARDSSDSEATQETTGGGD